MLKYPLGVLIGCYTMTRCIYKGLSVKSYSHKLKPHDLAMSKRWTKAAEPKISLWGFKREVILSINISPATTAQQKVLLKWSRTQRTHLSLAMSIQRSYRVIKFYPTNSLGREYIITIYIFRLLTCFGLSDPRY